MQTAFKPLKLAAWLFTAGVCYGITFSAGWLILGGVAAALLVLAAAIVLPFFK